MALREFDGVGQRMPVRNAEQGDYAATRCDDCAQWYDTALPACVVCGATNGAAAVA